MKKRNHFMAVLLVALMMASSVLTGCGSGKDTGKKDDTAAVGGTSEAVTQAVAQDVKWDTNKQDTITLCVINNYYTAGEKKLAEDYMKLHPETKVVVDVVSDNDAYMTKMQTSLSGDKSNAADIVHGNFAAGAAGGTLSIGVDKGYFYDMTEMLDEVNPYNDGKKVRDVFDEADIANALNGSGGTALGYLPFDKCGVAFYYNKAIFDKLGLKVPASYEELNSVCEQLKANGYDRPISAGTESEWLINFIADSHYRATEHEYIIQPGDALYDANTMSANDGFKFDENNMDCDTYVVASAERQAKYSKEIGVDTDSNTKVWSLFQNISKYFTENWISADSAQVISDFETQRTPILFNGSWNAGLILSDINQLPADSQFEWATFQLQSFDNPPEGFNQKIRGIYVLGNVMTIVQKGDADHLERVKDFYKFWYSPTQAKTCYEETLANGNFVQGPCVIKGVELSEELTSKLDGFIATGNAKSFSWATGQSVSTQADKPIYNDLITQLSDGKLDVSSFLKKLSPVFSNATDDMISKAGYDLDPATQDVAK